MKFRHNRTRPPPPSTTPDTYQPVPLPPKRFKSTPTDTILGSSAPFVKSNIPFLLAILTLVIIVYATRNYLFPDETPLHHPPRPRRRSLLEIHSTNHLPSCSANRISLASASSSDELDSSKPTIYTDWPIDTPDLYTTTAFIEKYGHIPQYIKMGDALPLIDKSGKLCTASFKDLITTLVDRFVGNQTDSDADQNENNPPIRSTNDDILIFTNNLESPELFSSISKQFNTPTPLLSTTTQNEEWPQIFSVMMKSSSHRFHIHDEAWLGQISGSRLWFLLPPSTDPNTLQHKPPACEYLYNRELLPPDAMACVQNAGEVMYLPKNWWHATCGLEEWNVGVGEQRGAPALRVPGVEERSGGEWEEVLKECLGGGAFGVRRDGG